MSSGALMLCCWLLNIALSRRPPGDSGYTHLTLRYLWSTTLFTPGPGLWRVSMRTRMIGATARAAGDRHRCQPDARLLEYYVSRQQA